MRTKNERDRERDCARVLNRSIEEVREYMSVASRRAATDPDPRAQVWWAIAADRCRGELIRRGTQAGGKVGGRSRSEKKIAATRKNAALARATRSKKRQYPLCPGYKNHSHRFNPDGRCYSPVCREQNPDLIQHGSLDERLEEFRETHLKG